MSDRIGPKPRIAPLPRDEAVAIGKEHGLLEQISELNVFRTLLKHPALAKAINDLLMVLLGQGNQLDARLRELIIMRIGWVTASNYEWTQHWRVAQMFEMSEDELLDVRDWENASRFNELDRAILKATDETLADGMISRATWDTCAKHLESEAELLEICGAIGAWRVISQIARSVEFELEDGVASWPPDGARPASATPSD